MPLTTAFMNSCRVAVAALPEFTAFNTAGALADDTRAERVTRWGRLYSVDSTGTSVANRLRKAVRDTVNAKADIHATAGSGVIAPEERESAYATLIGEFVPVMPRPTSDADETAALLAAINEGLV